MVFAFLTAVAVAVSARIFAPGLLVSGDNPTHLAEIYGLKHTVLVHQHWWSGWLESDFAGYPVFTYQYPLGKILVLLLNLVLGLEIPFAYKLILLFSWVLPAVALAKLLIPRVGALAAAVAGLLYLVDFDCLYYSLGGMWNQYLCAGIFLLACDALIRLAEEASPARLVLASLLVALSVITHPFMYLMIPLAWGIVTGLAGWLGGERWKRIRWYLVAVPFLSFLLASWYFIPILLALSWPVLEAVAGAVDLCLVFFPLAGSYLKIVSNSACSPAQLLEYSLGMVLALAIGIPGLIFLSVDWLRTRKVSFFFRFTVCFFCGLAFVTIGVLSRAVPFLDRIAHFVALGRFSLFLLLVLLLCVGYLLGNPSDGRRSSRPWRRTVCLILIGVCLARVGIAVFRGGIELPEFRLLYQPGQPQLVEMAEIETVWKWIRENTELKDGRVLFQDTLFNLEGSRLFWSHFLALSTRFTGRWSLGSFSEGTYPTSQRVKTEGKRFFGSYLPDIPLEDARRWLQTYNCKIIVACEPELKKLLSESSDFRLRYETDRFEVFEMLSSTFWAELDSSEGEVRALVLEEGHRVFEVETESAGNSLLVKTSYHPWWQVELDGQQATVSMQPATGLMTVDIPIAGRHVLQMDYSPPKVLPAGMTLLGVVLCCGLIWRSRRASIRQSR